VPDVAPDGRPVFRRGLGSPTLFAIVYTSVASALYFALGVVADNALGLTPLVFLIAGLFFVLAIMTYVEGSSLHQERAGSTVFARYAFNELWSFVAAWAILLDFLILIAVTAFMVTDYLAVFWGEFAFGVPEAAVAIAVVLYVAVRNVIGFSPRRAERVLRLVVADLALLLLIIVVGAITVVDLGALVDGIELGTTPRWEDFVFALTLATVAFTSLESAAGLAGEISVGRRGLRRLVTSAAITVLVIYVGTAVVALGALPVVDGETELGTTYFEQPMIGVVDALDPDWLSEGLRYVVAVLACLTLVAAAQSAMLGLSRLAYSLATNRQIPSAVGRLHPTRATPYVVIVIAAVLAAALALTKDLEFLVGIYAFGALLAFTLAHASIVVLRYREPDRKRPYTMPFNVSFRGGSLPIPAVIGAVASLLGWVSVVVLHDGARYVGFGWMLFGLVLYVVYRTTEEKPLFKRVRVPQAALQQRETRSAEYGSILVPLAGNELDDDIVQTAGPAGDRRAHRRRRGRRRDRDDRGPVDLRGPDGAADRRAAAREPARGGASGAAAREGRRRGVRGRAGRHRDRPRAAGRPGDRRGGAPPRRRGDRPRRRAADAGARRRAAGRAGRRAQRDLRWGCHEVRGHQGAVPRDHHRAAGKRPRAAAAAARAG
jgi:APA family basic amino acid/polyamine antiporter